jgi:hypothetical protein
MEEHTEDARIDEAASRLPVRVRCLDQRTVSSMTVR